MANEVFPIKSKRDYNKFIKALKPGRDQWLAQLGTAFGLRISDLLLFKIGELRGQKSITLREKKRKKKRVITFSPSVLKIVSQLEGDDDDYVFASRKGGEPITRVQAYRILNDAAKRAGIYDKIGGIGTHTLRKTFGYRLYENGVDVSRIMSILNHSSERDTLKYIGITADEIEAAYESIEV
ncbi:tyrosine-type recombinase/integrase [Bacillus sp. NSP9.1]|uniref:tyrosine-type recombinase/integrase n=1 Tax=Bacillus sp. NSP9.1 TaxID=1071078 RepID=UPI0003FE0E69|nr:tyrosine-type recombinase/integrase [Bacillus sp. NSP9.1]QHZ49047.1 tyrosine-type recombinase/integrase [Bacillus sp. NSP9.1]